MNNLLGAVSITIPMLVLLFAYIFYTKPKKTQRDFRVSQSMLRYRYSNIAKGSRRIKPKTQSGNHHTKTNLKVIIVDNNAYWIKDNIFYKAPMLDEHIDNDLVHQVDTMTMNKVQLEQMLFIMDKLREGIEDDSRGSGD